MCKTTIRIFIVLMFVMMSPAAFAGLKCTQVTSWEALQTAMASQHYSWLKKPLSETLNNLSAFKRYRLQKLLKAYNPEVDFLFPRNAELFVNDVFQIMEGPKTSSDREFLTRMAMEQVAAKGLQDVAQILAPENPTLFQKAKQKMAKIMSYPMMSLLGLPPHLPFWKQPNLPEYALQSLIERRFQKDLDLFETLVVQGRRTHQSFLDYRRIGNRVLFTFAAVVLSLQMNSVLGEVGDQSADVGAAALREYQQDKTNHLDSENKRLKELQVQQDKMKNSPVEYMNEMLLQEFVSLKRRQPTQDENQQLQKLALKLAAEVTELPQ